MILGTAPENPSSSVLSARSLAKRFGSRTVVNDVSIEVRAGEVVGLLGPNGAGKTTTFSMVVGLVEPDAGEVLLDGEVLTDLPMFRRARMGVGYLPQENSIFRKMTALENLLAILETLPIGRRERMDRARTLLEDFKLDHLSSSMADTLSGGERRRLEIARALTLAPRFMLLDEPFAGIDPIAVGDIRALVRHLTRRGIGVLITDHNVRETLGLVDRAYIIHSGSVLMEGTPEEIVENDDVRRLYLGEEFRL